MDLRTTRIEKLEEVLEERGSGTKLIPLVILPSLGNEGTDEWVITTGHAEKEEWLKPQQRAPQWVDLMYDLVIAAILSVFSLNNEISSPKSVAVYFSYFIIIRWIWVSQVAYDVRFQANDWLHRMFKFFQVATFAFVGITSQNFDPSNVLRPTSLADPETAATQQSGATAFKGVACAYAASRLLLAGQYLYVAFVTRHYRRFVHFLAPVAVSLFSAVLWFTASFLTKNAEAKVTMAYTALALELVVSFAVLPSLPGYIRPPMGTIAERYGALTLVIIGEGIIGVVTSLSDVVAGFGFQSDAYVAAFCTLVIIMCLWHLLFHGFKSEMRVGRKRGVLWLLLHFPLDFMILVLLAGLRNAVTFKNIEDALDTVEATVQTIKTQFFQNHNYSTADLPMESFTIQFAKLDLQPTWPEEVAILQNLAANYPNHTSIDPNIELYQYQVQIFIQVGAFYGLTISQDILDSADKILMLNETWPPPQTSDQQLEYDKQAEDDTFEFLTDYVTDLAQGTLFFLPCAGGLLFVASVIDLLRAPPLGLWMWIAWASRLVGGIVLSLLGLLDIGNKALVFTAENRYPSEIAVYRVLDSLWMLPIVAMSYFALVLVDCILMVVAGRAEARQLHPSEV